MNMIAQSEPLQSCAFPLNQDTGHSGMLEATGRGCLETQKLIESKVW